MRSLHPVQKFGRFPTARPLAFLLSVMGFAVGCNSDEVTGVSTDEKTQILTSIATSVVLPTLTNFKSTTAALATATAAFGAAPTTTSLESARSAWRAARAPWESTEAFGFGPAETGGFDGNSDSWPVNLVDLDLILTGSATIDQSYIDGIGEDVKGFHAIEYVLFGADGSKTAAAFTARELAYLVAATQNLATQGAGIVTAWSLTSGYGHDLATAGAGSTVYATQKDALQELVQGMADVADEVGNSKLAGPLGPPVAPELLESRFSNNTGPDLLNNVQGVINVYNGLAGGQGIKNLVQKLDPAVDAEVTAAFLKVTTALNPITANFEASLSANTVAVQAAITALGELQTLLVTKVLPLTQQ